MTPKTSASSRRCARTLSQAVTSGVRHQAEGENLAEVLENLFSREPGLENHLLDEDGRIRPHVLIFVDAARAATVEEVANLCVYVAYPQASATTGAALRVDGGVVDTIA